MARKRMIDPEFWSDEEIGLWSFAARLFYIGLWNFADDEGRFKAHDQLLKSQIFPYNEDIDIKAVKKEMNGKIQWYEVEGLQYGYVRNFLKHQWLNRPTKSKLPPPPKITQPTHRGLTEDSQLIEKNRIEKNRREGAIAPPVSDEDFIKTLKTNKAYQHIDIENELAKMDAWLSTHKGRQKTRRFVVNWLNKIDKPVVIEARKPKPKPGCSACNGTGKLPERGGAQCFCVV